MRKTATYLLSLAAILCACANSFASPGTANIARKPAPLSFIENKGQVTDQYSKPRADVQFSLKAADGLAIFIGSGTIHYQFSKVDDAGAGQVTDSRFLAPQKISRIIDRMDVELIGANKNAQVITEQRQAYYENYVADAALASSITAHAYNRITYKNIYPNIDWVLYTKNGHLEHEFVVKAGGKVSDIKLKYGGDQKLVINADGSLSATTPQGIITEQAPDTYQKDGRKVSSAFKLDRGVLSYATGRYEGELVIDPTLGWATYYGGTGDDRGASVATDHVGNVYLFLKASESTTGMATTGAYQTVNGGQNTCLVKFDSSGARLWATYYGGNGDDIGFGVATDASGNVFITGSTNSSINIATPGSYQTALAGVSNAFLAKFNSAGAIQWATYYGGSSNETGYSLATDASGNVYMAGSALSTSGVASVGSYQSSFGGGIDDAFLVKFNSSGARQWATYYGGSGSDLFYCIATDASGNVYASGQTQSTSAISSSGAYQATYGGGSYDAFLVKFTTSGSRVWATYYGGSNTEFGGTSVALDPSGNIYMSGSTMSTSGIATSGAYQTTFAGGLSTGDGFLVKFNNAGTRQWGTYFGGALDEEAYSVAIDLGGSIYMVGSTNSTSGIATVGSYQTVSGGTGDGFIAKFDTTGAIQYGSYYGGSGSDALSWIGADPYGNVYAEGTTTSTSGIATPGAYQSAYGGGLNDAFLVKLDTCLPPGVAAITGPTTVCPGSTITLSDATGSGTWSSSNTSIATVSGGGVVTGVSAGNVVISYIVANSCGTGYALSLVTVGSEIITTIAGTGIAGYLGDSLAATSAELKTASGVFGDAAGNLYLADYGNNVIRKINTSGIISTIAGTGTAGYSGDGSAATGATLNHPSAVYVDPAGNVFIADYNNNVVRKINTSGIISTVAGNGIGGYTLDGVAATSTELYGPEGFCMDPSGNLYIADGLNSRVRELSVSGILTTFAGTGLPGFSGDGGLASAAELYNPYGLWLDGSGNMYVCDQTNHRVRKINAAGIISTIIGTGTPGSSPDGTVATAANINTPTGVAVDAGGNILVSDRANSCVRKITVASGIVNTIVNTAITAGFSGDGGSATAAKLNGGQGIFIDAPGNLYVADYSNSRIRKVAPVSTTISTPSTTLCQGTSVVFTNLTAGGAWTSSNSTIASVGDATGIVTGTGGGVATITYTKAFSCGASYAVQPVTVNAFTAGTLSGPSVVCPGSSITLIDAGGTGGTWSSNNPAAGTVSSAGIVTGIASGNTVISYTIVNGCGTIAAMAMVSVGNLIINTIAGNGTPGFTGDGGPATAAELNQNYGLAYDTATTNLYIADQTNNRIRQINTTTGIITTIAGIAGPGGYGGDTGPASAAKLNAPTGVAIDAAGNVYIADANNNRIRMITMSTGIITSIAGTGAASFTGDGGLAATATLNNPRELLVDGSGNVIFSDGNNQRIRMINNSTGIITTIAGSNTTGAYSGDGGAATAARLNYPRGIAYDAAGNLYIADMSNSRIRMVAAGTGIITTVAGNGFAGYNGDAIAATTAWINLPIGVTIDPAGNIIITDVSNNRVRSVNAAGIISTIVGTAGTAGYSGDGGLPAAAKINSPRLLVYTPSGNYYFSDYTNNAVRYVKTSTPPSFTGGTNQSFSLCENATAYSLNTMLTITDPDQLQTETWSTLMAPANGTLVAAATATSNGGTIIPAGLSYTPAPGYSGLDSFSVQASDGCTGTTLIVVTVNPLPVVPAAITGPTSVCLGSSATLSDVASGGTWTSTLPAIATIGSGSGSVNGLSAGVTVISYTITNSCGANSVFRNDTVFATPVAILGTTSLCVGATSTLSDIGSGTWTSSAPSVATIGASSGLVTALVPGTTIITYSTGGSCNVTTIVTVNAYPAAITPAGAVTICAGATTSLADATSGGTWSSGGVGNATVGSTGIVTGVAAGTATISYTSVAGCAVTRQVTVLVTPSELSPASAIVCTGNTMMFTESVGGGVWSSTAPAIASVLTGTVTGVTTGTANISYTIGSCAVGAPVTVNLSPDAGAITGSATLCTGSPGTYTDAAAGGTWSSSNTAIATIGSTGLATGIANGTVVLSYSVSNSCGTAVATKTIVVSTAASAGTIVGSPTVCAGTFTLLTDATTGGTWSASNINATISGTGLVVGVIPGVDTITYTVTNTCGTASTTKIITVGAYLSAGVLSGPASVCVGSSVTLASSGPGGGVWSSSNVAASVSGGTVAGLVGGTDTISYTITASCGAAIASQVVTVIPTPVAGTITGPGILCTGSVTTYTDASPGGVWGVTNATATISGTGIVTALTTGADTITYTVTNTCGTASTESAVYIGTAVVAGTISGPGSVCAGATITMTDPATGGAWSVSNSHAIIAAGVVTGLSAGIDTVIYTVTGTCGTVSTSATIVVNPLPAAGTISGPASLCAGSPVTYTDPVTGGIWGISNSHATIISGGLVTPVSAGLDTVGYTVTNGCGTATATLPISVTTMPAAGTISGPGNVCTGTSVTLTDAMPGGAWSAANSAATVTGGVVTGVASGIDTISYTVASSCGTAVATKIIDVSIAPSPGTITGLSGVCIGTSVTLADTAIGGAWSASNATATISTSGIVTGIVPGNDTISYTVTNVCGSFATTYAISVSTIVTAGTISGPATVCAGGTITLTDTVAGGVWGSSNADATVAGGVVTGMMPGADTITYVVTNACGTATASSVITIGATLEAGTISGPADVCIGSSVTLSDPATGGIWGSSNADATVAGGVVTGIAPGVDTISYTVSGACGTVAATMAITVNLLPSAGTITGATGVCAGATTTLADAVPGGTWSAANTKATVSGGIVTGVLAGLDTIRYSVTNGCGSAVALLPISVNGLPAPGSISGATSVCPGAMVTLMHSVSGGAWSSSNTGIATVSGSGMVTGVVSGTATISYTVSNSCGHSSATHGITVLSLSSCGSLQVNGAGNGSEELKVAPNPNNGSFTMNLASDIDEEVQVLITNVLGEKVKEFTTTTNKMVDLQLNAAPGIYLLSASTANGRHVAKVIVN